jgi:hypothetical protein
MEEMKIILKFGNLSVASGKGNIVSQTPCNFQFWVSYIVNKTTIFEHK